MKLHCRITPLVVALALGSLAGTSTLTAGGGWNARWNGVHPGKGKNKIRANHSKLPKWSTVRAELQRIVAEAAADPTNANGDSNGGFGLDMWATLVNRDGEVCVVAFSGDDRGDQWPGSRVISAQKANTANAFSLPGLALSTSNLYSAVQPGDSLYGLQFSNPVDPSVAYKGPARFFGTKRDPMVGQRIGGVNVFGGGLACYNSDGELVGALGVSGDTSCTDHIIAWKLRFALNLDNVPTGVSPTFDDNAVYDIDDVDPSGWGHPDCGINSKDVDQKLIAADLPNSHPTGPDAPE